MSEHFFSCPDCGDLMVGDVHVMPIDDMLPHYEIEGCHCDPEVIIGSDNRLIVHNPFDSREPYFEE